MSSQKLKDGIINSMYAYMHNYDIYTPNELFLCTIHINISVKINVSRNMAEKCVR
jgi:hypothetical protein